MLGASFFGPGPRARGRSRSPAGSSLSVGSSWPLLGPGSAALAPAAVMVLVTPLCSIVVAFAGVSVFVTVSSMAPGIYVVSVPLRSVGARLLVSPLRLFIVFIAAMDTSSVHRFAIFGVIVTLLPSVISIFCPLFNFASVPQFPGSGSCFFRFLGSEGGIVVVCFSDDVLEKAGIRSGRL